MLSRSPLVHIMLLSWQASTGIGLTISLACLAFFVQGLFCTLYFFWMLEETTRLQVADHIRVPRMLLTEPVCLLHRLAIVHLGSAAIIFETMRFGGIEIVCCSEGRP